MLLQYYFKILLRHTALAPVYNAIIVAGLALGTTASLIIAQYISFELSYDREFKGKDDITAVFMDWKVDGEGTSVGFECHPGVIPLLKKSIPQIELAGRVVPVSFSERHDWMLRRTRNDGTMDAYVRSDELYYGDQDILDMFSIAFVQGRREDALSRPNTVVLSQELAGKLFAQADPLGELIELHSFMGSSTFTVVGVARNQPVNSGFRFNALMSLESFPSDRLDATWDHPTYRSYIKLARGYDAGQLNSLINKVAGERLREAKDRFGIEQHLITYPYSDIHFYSPARGGNDFIRFSGDRRALQYFAILGVVIMVVSWANYVNLTTARAVRRAKEVGLRKINGAGVRDLVKQFLVENLVVNVLSVVLAITLAQLIFPMFASAIGSKAHWSLWNESWFFPAILFFIVISTVISGFYPAIILSGYEPALVLKGNFSTSQRGSAMRNTLVCLQFSCAVLLLASVYIITRQVFFMEQHHLGQSSDDVLVINAQELDTTLNRADAYFRWRDRITARTDVNSAAAAGVYPAQTEMLFRFYRRITAPDQRIGMQTHCVSSGYLKTMHIPLLYGRDFIDGQDSETSSIILSKNTMNELGFKDLQSMVGERIQIEGDTIQYEIVGICDDFRSSMKTPTFMHALKYQYFSPGSDHFNYFLVRLNAASASGTSGLKDDWTALFPNTPFDQFALNTVFGEAYINEYQFASVFGFFSLAGVVITCIGLYGLSLYNTGVRTKEIAIRKSLGASVSGIVWILSKGYLKLMLIAAVVCFPISFWLLDGWLKTYPDRISINADAVLIPMLAILVIVWLSAGFHTFRAASGHPGRFLRSE